METQTKTSGIRDLFINLGAFVALYTVVVSLLNLLFTVINVAYPQINSPYSYMGYMSSQSISWPVATLMIAFPIFIILMWLLEREYKIDPEKQSHGIHRWLTYITLFVAGVTVAGDLVTVLYYFIDGQELTTGFLLKVLVLFVIASAIFVYYVSDVAGKLTSNARKIWRVVAIVIVLGSIVWGFAVLGSPRTQQLYKYDQQKMNSLQNLDNQVKSYYADKGVLPKDLAEISSVNYYILDNDPQTNEPYEYEKINDTTYSICAEFNKASDDKVSSMYRPYDEMSTYQNWTHPAGRYCFERTIKPEDYNYYPSPMKGISVPMRQ